MLLGKLETPATKVYQSGPFSTTTATAEYMVVATQKYVIGGEDVVFEVRFGNIVTEHNKERFDILMRQDFKMTSDDLSTWGTDDSVLLDLIAAKLGTTVIEKINKDFTHTY